jgi:heme exporter protein D
VSEQADVAPGDGRNETPTQRADRNWNELLQEFRVFQTGTQILAAFLLTLPFQQRFSKLPPFDVGVYLVLVFLAVVVTLLALAPVSLHRLLFRQRAKIELVRFGSTILIVCLAAASLLFTGIVLFIVDFLLAPPAGMIAAGCVFVVLLVIWVVLPLAVRAQHRRHVERR